MKASKKEILRHVFLISLFLGALLSWNVMTGSGQESAPKRGFQAGGSYALSDIESINTTNGNMMMHFPLASLPVGRGGLSAGINLIYNSKLYDSHTTWHQDHYAGKFGCPPEGCFFETTDLGFTDDGGWKYMTSYWLEVIDRTSGGSLDPTIQCPTDDLRFSYRFKLKIHFPDGSVHELRPSGFSDGNTADPDRDYYNILPDGWTQDCQGHHLVTAQTVSYYSTDGTYLRLAVEHDSDDNPVNNLWTLSLPDGTRVTGASRDTSERIYDRNNNYVQINNLANYNYQNTNHQAVQLVDQLNRTVTLVYRNSGTDEDAIVSQGFGDELVTKVRWSSASVGKTYWPCPEAGGMSCQTHDGGQQQTPYNLFVGLAVVDRITLPVQAGNLFYSFSYNAPSGGPWPPAPSSGWGELSSVTLPSGAQASYHYLQDGDANGMLSTPDVLQNSPTQKDLAYDQEYDGASNHVTETWTYSTSDPTGMGVITSPDGGVTTEYSISTNMNNNQPWNAGLVYKSVHPDGSKTERLWAQNHIAGYGPDNPYVKTEFTSIKSGTNYVKTDIKDYNYDKNGNVTRVAEYDWMDYTSVPRNSYGDPAGIPSGAVPTRVTTNNYYASTPDASQSPVGANIYWFQSSPLLKNAVAASELSDGSGNVFSRTEFDYDGRLTTGNLTLKKSWDSTKGAYSSPLSSSNSISVSSQYDYWSNGNTGKLIQTTDARGTQTVITYGNVGGVTDLYPTQTVTASGTSIARTETRAYDFATGLVTSATDADNNVTTSTIHDVFGRPTVVKAAVGKPEETRARTEYDDTLRRVIVHSDLNSLGDEKLVAIQHYDQLGRVRLSRRLEDSTTQSATDEVTGIKVQMRYLFSGSNSYTLSSNPYRAAYSNQASEGTMGWARSKSDNSGRMIEVQTFGGSSLPAPWSNNTTSMGTVTTAYDANFTTVTDQALRMRRSMSNGLGQLVRVDEPGDPNTNNSLGTTDNPAQPTNYAYDTLGNLLTVNQGSQTRSFTYSSLARLLTATNPESGTLSYQYDNNGNLLQKTDPRLLADNQTHVTITYDYDALNRVKTRTYNDGTAPNYTDRTPAVTYTYDSVSAYGKGRLASVSSSVSSYSYSGYDALGRALGGSQTIGSQNYPVGYTYDRAGHVLTETYPSGRTVTNAYDNAGRLSSFTGNLGDDTTRTYSMGLTYASAGQMTQERFGTTPSPIYTKLAYNARGQLAEILASTTGNDSTYNRGKIVNDYSDQCSGASCNGTDNNGNLKKQTVFVPDQNQNQTSWNQRYGYDSLNRLTNVGEYLGSNTQPAWQQSYNYDRWGNRLINNNSSATWGQGINNVVATVDPSSNQMYASGDISLPMNQRQVQYDAASNQTKDYLTSNGTRVYDAENRMISATDSSYHTSTYTYDGDGHRVRRNIAGAETWQVYGLGGELLAEYGPNTSPSIPQKEYGYRNGQLLITATAPSGLATNTLSDTKPGAAAIAATSVKESEAADAGARTPENELKVSLASAAGASKAGQPYELLASIKGLMLPQWSGIGFPAKASTEAVSDSSTPLFGPSFPYAASLNRSAIPLMPQSGSAQIAFASNRDGSAQIYSMNTDGSGPSRLTNDAANDEAPNWSPNNSRIVFQSDRDNLFSGIADIYVMNWDGSGQTRLTSDPADDSAPVWSPDGTKIAFQSARNGVSYQVYVMNADGSGQINISNSTANDTQPSWSPDGSKIAFASDRDQAGFSSVYVMNANGTNQTRLTTSSVGVLDQQPAWSPDGMKLAFISTRDSTVVTWDEWYLGELVVKTKLLINKEVYVMNADGNAQVRLTNTQGNDDSPVWSGDGTKIAFRSDRDRNCCDPTQQVWVMNADGSSQANLSNNGYGDHCPSWQHVSSNVPPAVSLTSPANGASFTAPANITITANASDSDGSISRVDFYQGVTLIGTATASPYTISWNGVAAGTYSLTARATDNLGAQTNSSAVSITVNAPPAVSITTPTQGATFTAPANITVTANASDGDGSVSRVDFYQGSTLIGTATASPYTISWSNVTAGSYSLTARATDNLGATTTSAAVSISVNAPPAVSITAPTNGASFTAPANITITANASDSDGSISRVDFYQGTTLIGTATTSPYTVSWNNVAAGGYPLTARATDNLGASTTSNPISITVGSPPTVSFTTPANGASFTAPANVTLTANASSSNGTINRVEFYQGTTLIGTSTASPYTITWDNVTAGSYSLTAKATDNLGATTASAPVSITVNAPPTVSITTPTNGASFTAPASITVTANASDSDGSISRVDFYQGTTLIGTATTNPYTVSWNNVAAGGYSLTARATDNLAASTTSNPVNITVGSPPTVSVATPTNGATFTAPANVSITANASAFNGSISRVDFYQGTALIGTSTASPYTITWNNVTAGSYSLTAKATDNQGATTTSNAISITVNPPPAVADVRWIVTDQLGTPRMIFDQSGSLTVTDQNGNYVSGMTRHDYLPFGEELYAGVSSRTPQQGYTGDSTRQKFTTKERDTETGLDYFLARYYSSTQGRFTSPDEFSGGPREVFLIEEENPDKGVAYADTTEPQSLNKYQYCLNNPLRYIDPDGHQQEEADQAKKGAQGAAIHTGAVGVQESRVRREYNTRKSGVTTPGERDALRSRMRQKSSVLGRTLAGSEDQNAARVARRAAREAAGTLGETIQKTSPGWNRAAKWSGRAGGVLLVVGAGVSVYNIATAPEGQRAQVAKQETGSWGGALVGGEIGATMGSAGGPVGAFVGGAVGSAVGAVSGSQWGKEGFRFGHANELHPVTGDAAK
jgi:RHS repeat-associated protein